MSETFRGRYKHPNERLLSRNGWSELKIKMFEGTYVHIVIRDKNVQSVVKFRKQDRKPFFMQKLSIYTIFISNSIDIMHISFYSFNVWIFLSSIGYSFPRLIVTDSDSATFRYSSKQIWCTCYLT